MSSALLLEIAATAANLLFIILLIREHIACWLFGIIGSLLSVYLFITVGLYSESLLFVFYAVMGVWGWLRWHERECIDGNPVRVWRPVFHLVAVIATALAAALWGTAMATWTDAQRPWFDAATTAFSFFATYLEINKILEGWVYWFFINLASIWLYQDRDLDIYAALIALYTVLSVVGFLRWRAAFLAQRRGSEASQPG